MQIMKLDLIEIRKLSPVGLWDLAELAALIAVVQRAIGLGIGTALDGRRYARMAAQYRRELREQTLDNFNIRIKAWVMQCPDRIAEVRRGIGEAAIRSWKTNRLLDYAFTETFGDWKSAFPQGLGGRFMARERARREKLQKRRHRCTGKSKSGLRAYAWKPFALVKIDNAVRMLYGQPTTKPMPDPAADAKRAAYLKLWGVDIADGENQHKWTQPRQPRAVKPVRFTPDELVPEAATGTPDDMVGRQEVGRQETDKIASSKTSAETSINTRPDPPPRLIHAPPGRDGSLQENTEMVVEPKPP